MGACWEEEMTAKMRAHLVLMSRLTPLNVRAHLLVLLSRLTPLNTRAPLVLLSRLTPLNVRAPLVLLPRLTPLNMRALLVPLSRLPLSRLPLSRLINILVIIDLLEEFGLSLKDVRLHQKGKDPVVDKKQKKKCLKCSTKDNIVYHHWCLNDKRHGLTW